MSLLQPSLFGTGEPAVDPAFPGLERTELGLGAWIERVPGWLEGEQTVFDTVVGATTWHSHQRPMYDRIVDVPRLTASLPRDGDGHPVLAEIGAALSERTGEPSWRIGLAWYRDGRDSVAPHGDLVARTMDVSVMAIVSCGARRRFHLSPVEPGLRGPNGDCGAAKGLSFELGHGDLLIMGGTIQRTWRHGVPKTNRPVGPRLSMMFRPPWMPD